MNKHLIFASTPNGFFANFNRVIQALSFYKEQVGKISWDMKNFIGNSYNCDFLYESLFVTKQPSYENNDLETIVVKEYIDHTYTAHDVANRYLQQDQSWRHDWHNAYKTFIGFTDFLSDIWEKTYSPVFTNEIPKVGILARHNALGSEQPHRRMPHLEQYYNAISALNLSNFKVVCAVDSNEMLAHFTSKYDCFFNAKTTRTHTPNDLSEAHHRPGMNIIDAAYHFLEAYMLSKCDHFIHPVSNTATAALFLNPNLKNTFIIG